MKRRSFFAAVAGAIAVPQVALALPPAADDPPEWDNDDGRYDRRFTDLVTETLRAHPECIADNVGRSNALYARLMAKGSTFG